MHDTVTEELGILQTGNHAEHPLLLAEREVRLEPDKIVCGAFRIFRTQLNGGPRTPARTRIRQTHGLHSAESDGIVAGSCNFLGRLTGLEQITALEIFQHNTFGTNERIDECVVFILSEGGIEIIPAPLLVIARLGEHD